MAGLSHCSPCAGSQAAMMEKEARRISERQEQRVAALTADMLKMYEDFSAQGETDNAAAIWDALSAYVSGSATIVFRRGIPFISPLQGDDITEES